MVFTGVKKEDGSHIIPYVKKLRTVTHLVYINNIFKLPKSLENQGFFVILIYIFFLHFGLFAV